MQSNHCLISKNKFSSSIIALFIIRIFSTLSFSVLYSTLALYMTSKLAFPLATANSIMGVFVSFNFALHLLGGYWGGRFFSNRMLFSLGMVAQMIGCVLLSIIDTAFFYYGLAAFLMGSGVSVTCLNCMLTQRFKPEDNRREGAFLCNYAGMNIGFFIGFSLSGFFQLSQNYHLLFLFSSLGNIIALFICIYNWSNLADFGTRYTALSLKRKRSSFILGLMMITGLPFLLSDLLHYVQLANLVVVGAGFAMLALSYVFARQQKSIIAREKIYAFIVFLMVGTVFWTLFQVGPMGLTHFIAHNVQRNISSMIIPPQWFQNVNTICVVIGGPLFGYLFKRMRSQGASITIPIQFALSLVFIGVAFMVLPIGISEADAHGLVSPIWIVLCFILQSVSELLISPIGYSMIGLLAPSHLQGVMMGMWMLSSGVGATISSYSSNWMASGVESVNPLLTNENYSHVFLILGLTSVIVGILLFALSRLLKRWINQTSLEEDRNWAMV